MKLGNDIQKKVTEPELTPPLSREPTTRTCLLYLQDVGPFNDGLFWAGIKSDLWLKLILSSLMSRIITWVSVSACACICFGARGCACVWVLAFMCLSEICVCVCQANT